MNPNHVWLNAAAQYDDADSVYNYYRRLIALRHERAVVATGSFVRLDVADPAIFAFERALGDERLLVVVNLSDLPRAFAAPTHWAGATPVLANLPEGEDATLRPWEARVSATGLR